MMKLSIVMVLALITIGCTAAISNPAVRRAAANVEFPSKAEIGSREYTIISEVKGVDCQPTFRDTDEERARASLRVAAGKLQADAVINIACEPVGYGMHCGHSIECRGDAIKWSNDPLADLQRSATTLLPVQHHHRFPLVMGWDEEAGQSGIRIVPLQDQAAIPPGPDHATRLALRRPRHTRWK